MFYHHHPHVSINNHGGGADERLILEKIYPCKIEWSMVTPFMVKKTFVEQSSFLMSNSSTDIVDESGRKQSNPFFQPFLDKIFVDFFASKNKFRSLDKVGVQGVQSMCFIAKFQPL